MRAQEIIRAASKMTGEWLWSVVDAIPPFYVVEGVVQEKSISATGAPVIRVDLARISVDRPTFDQLSVGERVRVRYTRGARAINIDRYVTTNGRD